MEDDSLEDRTCISASDICDLVELCLRSIFQDTFFEQVEGVAMGSPLSPIVANLFMESFEQKALESAVIRPKMWLRYVDDTFVLWPHNEEELKIFHRYLNAQHSAIQFTCEEELEGRISFLDVHLERRDGGIATGVYKKKSTHTDRYIQYSSHHHPRVLTGVHQLFEEQNREDM